MMNEYDRDYIDRVKEDLARLDRGQRQSRVLFLAVVLTFFWVVTLLALLGFLR